MEYPHPVYMCFVDLVKEYDRVPWETLWEVLQEYEVKGSLLRAIQSLYVWVLSSESNSFLARVGQFSGLRIAKLFFLQIWF